MWFCDDGTLRGCFVGQRYRGVACRTRDIRARIQFGIGKKACFRQRISTVYASWNAITNEPQEENQGSTS